MEDIEVWKDVIGFEGLYMISSFGRVKSLAGKIIGRGKGTMLSEERILKNRINSHGYYVINLYKNGKCKTFQIHQLVAIYFLNHTQCGYKIVVDHVNNDKLNNHVSNLQLISNRLNSSKDRKDGSSQYTGVSWFKKSNKWRSNIRINGKLKHLGYFENEIDASNAYQSALNCL